MSLSKNCGRISTLSTVSSPPGQYTADSDCSSGWPGATADTPRSSAGAVNKSFDANLSRLAPLTRALRTMLMAATPGAFPASTCTIRAGNALTNEGLAAPGTVSERQVSSTSSPPSSCSSWNRDRSRRK
jgi:hypothetical protein